MAKHIWEIAPFPGRPRKFATADDLWQHFLQYAQFMDENPWVSSEVKVVDKSAELVEVPKKLPYSMTGFCIYLGVGDAYFRQYKANNKATPEGFQTVIERIMKSVEMQQIQGASAGFFNANIISRVLGLADKQDVTTKVIRVQQEEEEVDDDE
jgi:hypothetical protein